MKIKEVVTEAGILSKIGRGLAGAATGAIRMLDKAGGGTGDVGTDAQRDKREKKEYARARAGVGKAAFTEFADSLEQNNINLQDPDSYDPVSINNYLKNFAQNYFAVGDRYHTGAQQKAISAGVLQALEQIPVPTTLNNISAQDYLEKANTVRTSIINQVDRMLNTQRAQAAQPAADTTEPVSPAASPLPADLSIVSSSPVVLRYRNQDFALTDNDRWVRFGSNKLVSPEMEAYLNRQLEKL
jgi:hypothetical protein